MNNQNDNPENISDDEKIKNKDSKNKSFKKKYLEKIQHNNLIKSSKKNVRLYNKIIKKRNKINNIQKIKFNEIENNEENNKDIDLNENNNKFSKNRSKSISNLSEIIAFNKSSNKNENHNNNIKKFSNQKKKLF